MKREVEFYTGPSIKIAGILDIPDNLQSKPQNAVIVMCNGTMSAKEHLVLEAANYLNSAGYVTLRFDYRGVGESEGPRGRMIPLEIVEDIQNAIAYLHEQELINAELLGLWGVATGATIASYVAAIDTRVKCLVAVNGVGDMGRWFRSGWRYWEWLRILNWLDEDAKQRVYSGKSRLVATTDVFPSGPSARSYIEKRKKESPELFKVKREVSLESISALIEFNPEVVIENISPRAAMWLCASHDSNVPIDEPKSIFGKAKEPKDLVILDNLQHPELYYGNGLKRTMGVSIAWFDKYLS